MGEQDLPPDGEAVTEAGIHLADAIISALPMWVESSVCRYLGHPLDEEVQSAVETATALARAAIEAPLIDLLTCDIDHQRSTPLSVVRQAVCFPTNVLDAAGVLAPVRDPFDERAFPDDRYALSPATWSDLGPEVAEAGMRWSVTKAWVHKRRHQPDSGSGTEKQR